MEYVPIVVAGVSGGLAGAVASLIKTKSVAVRVAVAVICFGIFHSLLESPAETFRYTHETDAALEKIDFYRAVKRADPQAYERIRQSMIAGLKRGKGYAEVSDEIAGQVGSLIPPYLSKSSDHAAVRFLSVASASVKDFDSESCFALFYPEKRSLVSSPAGKVSPETTAELLTAMGDVMDIAIDHPQTIPTESDTREALQVVVAGLSPSARSDLGLIAKNNPDADERRKICNATREMFAGMLKLPEKEGGQLIRRLIGSSK